MLNTDLHRLHRSKTIDDGSVCERHGEQGFLLLGLVVAIFLILLALGVAAPRVAHELRREREVETVRRGNAYVRAIEVYYLKMGSYPGSMQQLEKSNNMRFLRKRYVDPLTGKDDWRIIHVGEAKTTVKGFFGKPLGGIESSGLGSNAGSASTGSGFGSTSGSSSAFGSSNGSSAFGSSSSGAGGSGMTGLSSSTSGSSSGAAGTSGSGSVFGSDSAQPGGPFLGVGLVKDGTSIMTLNEQTTYPTWEFIYDPRIEQLKAKVNLFGGGMTATDAGDLGSNSDSKSSFGSSNSNSGTSTGTGSQPSNGGFSSGSFGSGFGSGPSSSPNPTTNAPQ